MKKYLPNNSTKTLINKYGIPEKFMETWKEVKIVEDIDEGLKILVEKKIINSPDYWKGATECIKYLPELILAMANYINKEGK